MGAVVFYRDVGLAPEERDAMRQSFACTDSRIDIKNGDLVVGRYSMLPFYEEQARDVEKVGAILINSLRQHRYLADLSAWVPDLEDITPKTWYRLEDIPEVGPFVVKGQTNSLKFRWDEACYAADKKAAIQVYCLLQDDSLIGRQAIYIRQYVPLVTYMRGIHDLPITKEFRFFVAYKQILCGAYYWSSHVEDLKDARIQIPSADEVPREFLQDVIARVDDRANCYAIDVAQTAEGKWIVIELNDLQQSGLSENDPFVFYTQLKRVIAEQELA